RVGADRDTAVVQRWRAHLLRMRTRAQTQAAVPGRSTRELGDTYGIGMDTTMEFRTFDEMAAVLSRNTPHALVLDWWSRLERVIRGHCAKRGAKPNETISALINAHLSSHRIFDDALIQELHEMRRFRNLIAHVEAPGLSAVEAERFARRAWTIAWYIAEVDDKNVA
ncbi:MAG: hypothetical protein ACT4O5_09730, partial [Gammaproteobacteria bacterium]